MRVDLPNRGYRYWRVDDEGRLRSPSPLAHGFEWRPGLLVAECRHAVCRPEDPPIHACGCGLYACPTLKNDAGYFTADAIGGYGSSGYCGGETAVLGFIRMSEVFRFPHYQVLKSRYATIGALALPAVSHPVTHRRVRAAAERYEVPVVDHPSDLVRLADE